MVGTQTGPTLFLAIFESKWMAVTHWRSRRDGKGLRKCGLSGWVHTKFFYIAVELSFSFVYKTKVFFVVVCILVYPIYISLVRMPGICHARVCVDYVYPNPSPNEQKSEQPTLEMLYLLIQGVLATLCVKTNILLYLISYPVSIFG